MEETSAVATVREPIPDYRLIARNPEELEASRKSLVKFFDAKIVALNGELSDLEANLTIATKFPIKTTPITAQMNRVKRRLDFYEKAKAAVEAGFHIIPNFEADVFAIRTTRRAPTAKVVSGGASYGGPSLPRLALPPAPLGEGRYVDRTPFSQEDEYKNEKGEARIARWASGFDEVIDFPFTLARPEVLTATKQLMAAKIFDDLATLRDKQDPMVVGIIRDGSGWSAKHLTFLAIWFLDTKTL